MLRRACYRWIWAHLHEKILTPEILGSILSAGGAIDGTLAIIVDTPENCQAGRFRLQISIHLEMPVGLARDLS